MIFKYELLKRDSIDKEKFNEAKIYKEICIELNKLFDEKDKK